jgi:hypothetical protein
LNHPPRLLLLAATQDSSRLRAIEAALSSEGLATAQIWSPAHLPALAERQALAARRLLLERRRARGWDEMKAAAALASPAVRALIALAERQFDALVLEGSADREALENLLEARPGAQVTEVWMGRAADTSRPFGWMDWPRTASAGQIAAALQEAAEWLGTLHHGPAIPALVRFAGGNDPLAAQVERFHQTLAARCQAFDVPLYSPLFFDQGRLQAARLAAAVQQAIRPDTCLPILCVPQLQRAEFSHRLRAEGGQWMGAWLAGAERPVVALGTSGGESEAVATVELLVRHLRA